jgi:rhamnogalacturonyl hydrolase YesR
MGFPFIAYFGAVTNNATLLQVAYDQCRLYRDALILDGPTGKLWGHIYSEDSNEWVDKGIWGTGQYTHGPRKKNIRFTVARF